MKTIFETKASAVGGRNGHVKSEDGVIDMDVRIPNAMGGQGGSYTNPEQLFAAGYAACFDNAIIHIAQQEKKKIKSETFVTVGMGVKEDKSYALSVKIEVKIEGVEKAEAQQILEKAHATCPYSNATRGNIDVELGLL